jgi:protocatechuate 3,4-dioxygenase beta subunit
MIDSKRRKFLQQSAIGLTAAATGGLGAGLLLRADAKPTPMISTEPEAHRVLIQMTPPPKMEITASAELKKVTPQPYGPFYRQGAPFRGQLAIPGELGTTFILSGRVWALDTRRPLPGVVLDFWHVDMKEKYSDGVTDFRNRGRLISSETGAYELQSIRPIPYRPNPNNNDFWRCAHYHLLAVCPSYKPLVTEIHFQNDPKKSDPMFKIENAMAVEKRVVAGQTIETGVFDIVLEREG